MGKRGLEIERKWLIRVPPSLEKLGRMKARPLGIEQIYLTEDPPGTIRRLRRITDDGVVTYVLTIKRRISNLVRAEAEDEISEARATALLAQVDPQRDPIVKTRWVFEHAGTVFELDIFSEPLGLTILEAELSNPEQRVILPPLAIVREVTDELEFNNYELSRRLT